MFTIVQFENGRYGVRNRLTGIDLKKRGVVREFRSERKARKYAKKAGNRLSKRMNTVINGLQKLSN